MGFFDVEDIPQKKIIVPMRNVNTEHLKKLFLDYQKPPSLAQIKMACLRDGRTQREVSNMKQKKLKSILWNKNKIEEIKEDIKKLTDEEEPQSDAEQEEEPEWEGYDMEDSEEHEEEIEED